MKYKTLKFKDCIEKPIPIKKKIKQRNYMEDGLYPIVSQEVNLINGYTDDETSLIKIPKPVIVYGDHTQLIKYIDFDFSVGADGIKIILTKDFIIPKFFYYLLKITYIKSRGYARHFLYLYDKELSIPVNIADQKKIIKDIELSLSKTDKINILIEENKKLLNEFELSLIKENIYEKK